MEILNEEDFSTKENTDKKLQFLIQRLIINLIPQIIAAVLSILIFTEILSIKDRIKNPPAPAELTQTQQKELESVLDFYFPSRKDVISELPYSMDLKLNTYAKSAILLDCDTGSILWEKNADLLIPPASMTKLVEMYVVFEAVENGEVSLDDIVPLPPECWAVNMPEDASLMFLAQGQTVTLRKLLEGLSIASGNDASHAVAYYIAGDMESFVKRMNDVVERLNIKNTFFVESSGYSAENFTTARDFAEFARLYINRFPFSLKEFHSLEKLEWPPENPIVQYNTNKLLGSLEGCDGLKTGFINESGFNLALTAERNGRRYLSVTMRGPGTSTSEGNIYRVKDGTALMETAFNCFTQYKPENSHSWNVAVLSSKEKVVSLIPAKKEFFTIPHSNEELKITAKYPQYLENYIQEGKQYGTLTYSQGNKVLYTIPLVADRESPASKGIYRFLSKLVKKIFF